MISVNGVTKIYTIGDRRVAALDDVLIDIADNDFLTIVGRSGSGKTTLLRVLASLESPTSGVVSFNGRPCSAESPLPVGMVFQEPRLMPWLSVCENILFAYPPREQTKELRERAFKMASTVGLAGYEDALPNQLSGGMAQRAALGRALLKDPPVVLLDEPLGALDYFTRLSMQHELLNLYAAGKRCFIMVTHDVGEAVRLGTRVAVLGSGRLRLEMPISLPYPRPQDSSELRKIECKVLRAIDAS